VGSDKKSKSKFLHDVHFELEPKEKKPFNDGFRSWLA